MLDQQRVERRRGVGVEPLERRADAGVHAANRGSGLNSAMKVAL